MRITTGDWHHNGLGCTQEQPFGTVCITGNRGEVASHCTDRGVLLRLADLCETHPRHLLRVAAPKLSDDC